MEPTQSISLKQNQRGQRCYKDEEEHSLTEGPHPDLPSSHVDVLTSILIT